MDVEISQSEQWLRFVAWLEDNWRRLAAVSSVVIGIGIVVAFVLWRGAQEQRAASEELSLVLSAPEAVSAESLLTVAIEHGGTEAGRRALLLAAGAYYTEGRYDEALAKFQQFLSEQPAGPLTPQARLGIAACKEAQGQESEAIADYKAIVENPSSGVVVPQARFALANLYARQGQVDLARLQYQELANVRGSSLAAEAQARLNDLPPGAPASSSVAPVQPPAITATNQL
jgi:predicted negative regulator of RcsB-dependent stress response